MTHFHVIMAHTCFCFLGVHPLVNRHDSLVIVVRFNQGSTWARAVTGVE